MKERGLSLFLLVVAACAPLEPLPAGTPAFGVLGDVPYSAADVKALDRVIDELNAQALEFVVHIGDIGASRPDQACGDDWLLERKEQFARIRHRFILIPGDNEWTDCKDPMARLRRWRQVFCDNPYEYCEHRRWQAGGWVFVALNVPGSNNNLGHPEHAPRMAEVFRFLDEAVELAQDRQGLVILIQANPFFYPRLRDGYGELKARLRALGARMPGRVVLIHGDTHIYRDDEPLPGLRRIETWGSPFVGWVRGALEPDGLRVEPSQLLPH